jgi:predicted metal-dependent hydrolase
MAHHQLNHTAEARAAFAQAIEILQTKLPRLDGAALDYRWVDELIAHALVREAKGLIEGQPPATDPTAQK